MQRDIGEDKNNVGNWFVYVGNNPISSVDPLGLEKYNNDYKVNPKGCVGKNFDKATDEATEAQKDPDGNYRVGDKKDISEPNWNAFRHVYRAFKLARECGAKDTREFLNGREDAQIKAAEEDKTYPDRPEDSERDKNNNELGINLEASHPGVNCLYATIAHFCEADRRTVDQVKADNKSGKKTVPAWTSIIPAESIREEPKKTSESNGNERSSFSVGARINNTWPPLSSQSFAV